MHVANDPAPQAPVATGSDQSQTGRRALQCRQPDPTICDIPADQVDCLEAVVQWCS